MSEPYDPTAFQEIICTGHARERMEKRGVSRDDVETTLQRPDVILPVMPDGTRELRRRIGRRVHYVVIALKRQQAILITTGWSREP
ncbi:MAG: DUF4258 domain-containing protein [Candidatus Omnitrophica bacterium]|nr:DUF4258 domain-containing protein [Candidatus Omnitrophota bacterium]